jgi:hypothetical protein
MARAEPLKSTTPPGFKTFPPAFWFLVSPSRVPPVLLRESINQLAYHDPNVDKEAETSKEKADEEGTLY